MKLQNLINPELELKVNDNAVTFIEAQTKKGTLRDVTVHGLPSNVFVFSTDKEIKVGTAKREKMRFQQKFLWVLNHKNFC
jgi:uncharacterized protein (DUF2141 family)